MVKNLSTLSDEDLIDNLIKISSKENEATIELLVYLIEVDIRKLYLPLGYSSLFSYCTKKLKYSEPSAFRRINASRCIRKFPQVLELLKSNEVNLTTISLFSAILREENKDEVLSKVRDKSKREVEVVVQSYSEPGKRVLESIKPLFIKKNVTEGEKELSLFHFKKEKVETTELDSKGQEDKAIDSIEEKYKVQFSVGKEFIEKLNKIKALKSSKFTYEEIFKFLMDDYLKRNDPENRKQARIRRVSSKRTRHIPLKARDEVLMRDSFQCGFVSPDGVRCEATHNLEFDHINPFSKGGEHSVDNLRLLCRAHNMHVAEKHFGKEFMEGFYRNT